MELAPDFGAVDVLHFQMRSYQQFERKVLRNGIGHECNPERIDGNGCDQLELLAKHRRGELKAYYEAEALDPARIERGLALGELLVDCRLRSCLGQPVVRAEESPRVQELLRRCWEWSGEVADADREREERVTVLRAELLRGALERDRVVAQLEGELQLARREAAELRRTLDVVQRSRVMRYTAPARRAYYRLRRAP
jgi:hypothetical protein